MSTTLWGQVGTLSFSAQTDATNGLRRVAVVWNNYGIGQSVVTLKVKVLASATASLYLDNDAMQAQTFSLPGAAPAPCVVSPVPFDQSFYLSFLPGQPGRPGVAAHHIRRRSGSA